MRVLVLLGRFAPIHIDHLRTLQVLQKFFKDCIVIIGIVGIFDRKGKEILTLDIPWTVNERTQLPESVGVRAIKIKIVPPYLRCIKTITKIFKKYRVTVVISSEKSPIYRVILRGVKIVVTVKKKRIISATDIRKMIEKGNKEGLKYIVGNPTVILRLIRAYKKRRATLKPALHTGDEKIIPATIRGFLKLLLSIFL